MYAYRKVLNFRKIKQYLNKIIIIFFFFFNSFNYLKDGYNILYGISI